MRSTKPGPPDPRATYVQWRFCLAVDRNYGGRLGGAHQFVKAVRNRTVALERRVLVPQRDTGCRVPESSHEFAHRGAGGCRPGRAAAAEIVEMQSLDLRFPACGSPVDPELGSAQGCPLGEVNTR